MRTYEKPRLVALSLNGEDRLCGECATRGASTLLYKHESDPNIAIIGKLLDATVGDHDGQIERGDLDNVFAIGEETCKVPFGVYCKFLGANTVAWS